jgi:hypothetical protein
MSVVQAAWLGHSAPIHRTRIKTMKRMHLAALIASAFALAACGDIGTMAGDVAKGAKEAALNAVDTKTACTLAGQNEAFCGCLQTEIGAKLDETHIDALGKLIKDTLASGGDLAKAAEAAGGLDEKTKQAIGKCAVDGVVGAAKEEAGQ